MQNIVTVDSRDVYDEPHDVVYVNEVDDQSGSFTPGDSSPHAEKSSLIESTSSSERSVAMRRSPSSGQRHTVPYRGQGVDSQPLLSRGLQSRDVHRPIRAHLDADASVCARMTSAGGRITIPNSGK